MHQNQHNEAFEKLVNALNSKDHLDMALALQIAQHTTSEMQRIADEISMQVAETRNEFKTSNVSNLRRIIALEENLQRLQADLQNTRQERAEHEVREAEIKLQLAKAIRAGLSTQERIEVQKEVTVQLEKEDTKKAEENRSIWKQRTNTMITAIMVSVGVSIFMSVAAFIWWLVRMYIDSH